MFSSQENISRTKQLETGTRTIVQQVFNRLEIYLPEVNFYLTLFKLFYLLAVKTTTKT